MLFDPYTIAVSRHSQYLLADAHRRRVYRPQGWASPVVLVDGRLEGVWEYDKQPSHLVIKVDMFAPPTDGIKHGIEVEAKRLGGFLDAEVPLIFS